MFLYQLIQSPCMICSSTDNLSSSQSKKKIGSDMRGKDVRLLKVQGSHYTSKNGLHPSSLTVNFTILREREVATKESLLVSISVKIVCHGISGLRSVEITCWMPTLGRSLKDLLSPPSLWMSPNFAFRYLHVTDRMFILENSTFLLLSWQVPLGLTQQIR